MTNYTELIDRYINGELTTSDKAAFEAELKKNPELEKQYMAQLQVLKGVQRMGLQNQVSTSFKRVKQGKIIKQSLIAAFIALSVIGAVILVKNNLCKPSNNILYELNEQGNQNWSEADRALESQLFHINPQHDTIIETKNGVILSVPAGSFIDRFGGSPEGIVDIEIKEAFTAYDIMRAGLSTLSDGRLLETGGMLYLNARSGTDNLSINQSKPLTTAIPVLNTKESMMLFEGERKTDSSINWKNPKPLIRQLSTVNILSLDFYPEHFLDSLQGMGFDRKNKTLTDSIYYSFGCHGLKGLGFAESEKQDSTSVTEKPDSLMKPVIDMLADDTKASSDGNRLFKRNCAVCHSLGSNKLTGPGLAGVATRVPKPADQWLRAYILNNEKVIKSGDAYANKIYNENGKAAMTVFEGQLSDRNVNDLIRYITGQGGYNINDCYASECPEIDPARIHAIWDRKFNETILATKEFEARLKVIFKTCMPCVLDLYVNNLDKNLYELDSIAATITTGEPHEAFLNFFDRKDGGVAISNKEMRKLQKYVAEKRSIYAEASVKAYQKLKNDEAKLNERGRSTRTKHNSRDAERIDQIFKEELKLNMKDAYRQLGKAYLYENKRVLAEPSNYFVANISTLGWKNVDAYVYEATANRSTMNYTEPGTGKKAEIKYETVNVVVKDFASYDRIVSYMIPDKLSSFQKMTTTAQGFTEKLNSLMNYSIVVVGFKGNQIYFYPMMQARAGSYTVSLYSTSEAEINQRFSFQKETDLGKELNYQLFEQKETMRVSKIKHREEITRRLWPLVFPCAIPAK